MDQNEVLKKVTSSITSITRRRKEKPEQKSTRSKDDPMRVAIVCPYSMTIPGGVQNQVFLMSKTLRKRGIDARIIAPCDGAIPVPYIMSVGTTKSLKSNGSVAPLVEDSQAVSLTMDAISSFNPDVIHLHEPLVPGPTAAAMIAGEGAIVATFHAAGEGIQALKYFRHPARGAVSRVHKRIAVSNEAKSLAEQYLPGDYTIIPNCVDVKRIKESKQWGASKPTVLFVGRHEERKGLPFLIDAWLDSSYLQDSAQLWVAGVGELTEELKTKSKGSKSIEFLGRIDNTELFSRMRSADVVVAPALYGESFGIILIEAMAAGSAVVASDIAGYRDVARNEVEALLVPPGDSKGIKEAIERIMKDPALKESLIRSGEERIKLFGADVVVDQYVEVYKELIQMV